MASVVDLTLRCPVCGLRADMCFAHGDEWKKRPTPRHLMTDAQLRAGVNEFTEDDPAPYGPTGSVANEHRNAIGGTDVHPSPPVALTPNERADVMAEIESETEALWRLLERPALVGAEHRRTEAIEAKLREIDRLEGLLA